MIRGWQAKVLGKLGEIVLGDTALTRLFQTLSSIRVRVFVVIKMIDQALQVDPVVPDFQRLHEGILGHVLPICAHCSASGSPESALFQMEMTAGKTTLAVKRLRSHSHGAGSVSSKVIDVEDQVTLGCGKATEVRAGEHRHKLVPLVQSLEYGLGQPP